MKKTEREFRQISEFIDKSRNAAVGFMNYAAVATYWAVGAFVSSRLKSAVWGAKTVVELGDYLKTRNPKLKGFGRRQIYNMVEFYETYSTHEFDELYARLRLDEFVQLPTAQISGGGALHSSGAKAGECGTIVQLETAQLGDKLPDVAVCPHFLALTTFTNHTEIVNRCRRMDEKVFYILYAARERLKLMELRRAIVSDAYSSVMSKEKLVTKASLEEYCRFMKREV